MKKSCLFVPTFLLALIVIVMTFSMNDVYAQSSGKKTSGVQTKPASGYAFLALPSGTVWKMNNEEGFYTYEEAVKKFGSNLPTEEQWQELVDNCTWTWTGKGYKVSDKSGNSTFIPATGWRSCFGNVFGTGVAAFYWASSAENNTYSYGLWMEHLKASKEQAEHDTIYIFSSKKDYGQSVRLVK